MHLFFLQIDTFFLICMCRSSTTKDEKEDLDVIASEKTVHPEKATGKFAFQTE